MKRSGAKNLCFGFEKRLMNEATTERGINHQPPPAPPLEGGESLRHRSPLLGGPLHRYGNQDKPRSFTGAQDDKLNISCHSEEPSATKNLGFADWILESPSIVCSCPIYGAVLKALDESSNYRKRNQPSTTPGPSFGRRGVT